MPLSAHRMGEQIRDKKREGLREPQSGLIPAAIDLIESMLWLRGHAPCEIKVSKPNVHRAPDKHYGRRITLHQHL